jgi:FKBP-type peptidyl-prolyl cis-trans isomerase SlyD
MHISAPCVVALTWTLSDAQGRTIDELGDVAEFLVGGRDLLGKVEEGLQGHTSGYSTLMHLEPEHAFGDYNPDLVCFEDRRLFPSELEIGLAFEGLPEGSLTPDMPADRIYLVTEIYPSHVVLDGNHPLAGMALRLKLKVHAVRTATAAELEAGSVADSPLTVLGTTAGPVPGLPDGQETLH